MNTLSLHFTTPGMRFAGDKSKTTAQTIDTASVEASRVELRNQHLGETPSCIAQELGRFRNDLRPALEELLTEKLTELTFSPLQEQVDKLQQLATQQKKLQAKIRKVKAKEEKLEKDIYVDLAGTPAKKIKARLVELVALGKKLKKAYKKDDSLGEAIKTQQGFTQYYHSDTNHLDEIGTVLKDVYRGVAGIPPKLARALQEALQKRANALVVKPNPNYESPVREALRKERD